MTVSAPTEAKQIAHVSYRATTGLFAGLDFSSNLQLFFGVSLSSQPRVVVSKYEERLPSILILLAQSLVTRDGLVAEGIFRVPAENEAFKRARAALNAGRGVFALENEEGPYIIASLIKDYLRSLPSALLGVLSRQDIERLAKEDQTPDMVFEQVKDKLQEPAKSVWLWLVDFLALVSTHSEMNKMVPKALGSVFAPTLWFEDDDKQSMDSFAIATDMSFVLQKCIQHKVPDPQGDFVTGVDLVNHELEARKKFAAIWETKFDPEVGKLFYQHRETGTLCHEKPSMAETLESVAITSPQVAEEKSS